MIKIELNPKELYEACILSSLTHAVAVGMYPELNYEHSWDNINYNIGVVAEGPPKEVLTPANLGITFGLHMGLVKPDSLPSGLTACTATCCNPPRNHA